LCDEGQTGEEVVTLDSTSRCYDWYDRTDPSDNTSALRATFANTHSSDMYMKHSSIDNDLIDEATTSKVSITLFSSKFAGAGTKTTISFPLPKGRNDPHLPERGFFDLRQVDKTFTIIGIIQSDSSDKANTAHHALHDLIKAIEVGGGCMMQFGSDAWRIHITKILWDPSATSATNPEKYTVTVECQWGEDF